MLIWMIVKSAMASLIANKLRSILAMLGIIIGVGAVIAMLAIGSGAQASILQRISDMGTNLLIVRPGQRGSGGVMSGTQQNLTIQDALAILNTVPGVQQVTPVVGGSAQLKYYNKNSRVNVTGGAVTYFTIRNFTVEKGRPFTDTETYASARVAVIGPTTAQNLMGDEDPIGKTIKLNGINFKVIGVLTAKGDQGWSNPDDQAIIPYTVAMKQVFGLTRLREIDIQATSEDILDQVQTDTTILLRKRHRLADDTTNDFTISNQAEILSQASQVTQTFKLLLGSIAGISLLVGGIGIMNIMLVTVTERTREIGVRKAIGAKDRDILRQFLLEAILMSGVGGVIGLAMGIGIATAIGSFTSFAPVVTTSSIIYSLSFACSVGVFFGYYPARRAAALDPIEALRYE